MHRWPGRKAGSHPGRQLGQQRAAARQLEPGSVSDNCVRAAAHVFVCPDTYACRQHVGASLSLIRLPITQTIDAYASAHLYVLLCACLLLSLPAALNINGVSWLIYCLRHPAGIAWAASWQQWHVLLGDRQEGCMAAAALPPAGATLRVLPLQCSRRAAGTAAAITGSPHVPRAAGGSTKGLEHQLLDLYLTPPTSVIAICSPTTHLLQSI